MEREEKIAAAAVDFEDTRAGTDIKGLGHVLRERNVRTNLLVERARLIVAVSIATEATLVPAGTRNGNAHLYSGTEPGIDDRHRRVVGLAGRVGQHRLLDDRFLERRRHLEGERDDGELFARRARCRGRCSCPAGSRSARRSSRARCRAA